MRTDRPNLPEPLRKRSQGVAVLYYADGDYRCKWFTPQWFTDDEDEWWDVDAAEVRMGYLPYFRALLSDTRKEPGEPQQAGFEVYWDGELIHVELVEAYEPVPLEEEVE